MDWAPVFDEAFPRPAAPDAVIARFIATIARPMSGAEIRRANAGQQNPFPASDPLHTAWRPIDVSAWVIPDRPLPASYLSFLRWANGGEFRTGERWFQFFPARGAGHGVRAMMLAYQIPQYMPGAVPVALNGGGTFYLLDLRRPPVEGEYPVVGARAGSLSWEPAACVAVADSFVAACRGTVNIEDLR